MPKKTWGPQHDVRGSINRSFPADTIRGGVCKGFPVLNLDEQSLALSTSAKKAGLDFI